MSMVRYEEECLTSELKEGNKFRPVHNPTQKNTSKICEKIRVYIIDNKLTMLFTFEFMLSTILPHLMPRLSSLLVFIVSENKCRTHFN